MWNEIGQWNLVTSVAPSDFFSPGPVLLYGCATFFEHPLAISTMTQHEKVIHGNEKEMQSRANQLVSLSGGRASEVERECVIESV